MTPQEPRPTWGQPELMDRPLSWWVLVVGLVVTSVSMLGNILAGVVIAVGVVCTHTKVAALEAADVALDQEEFDAYTNEAIRLANSWRE